MDKIHERLERLETRLVILNEENSASKVTIRILENKLLVSEKKIQELTDERQTSTLWNAVDVKNNKRFRILEKEIAKLKQRQKQQIQEANEKFAKVDKLQHLLNGAILKNVTVPGKIERMSSRLDSVSDTVDDLQANAGLTSSQIDELTSRCSSLQKELRDFKSFRPKKNQKQQPQTVSAATPVKKQETPHVEFKATMNSHNSVLSDGLAFNRTVFVLRNKGQAFNESKGFFSAPHRGWYHFKFNLETRNSPQQILEIGLEVSNPRLGRCFWVCMEKMHGNGLIEGTNENSALLETGDHVMFKVQRVKGQPPDIACCNFEGKLIYLR